MKFFDRRKRGAASAFAMMLALFFAAKMFMRLVQVAKKEKKAKAK